jgi:hypothetical protein
MNQTLDQRLAALPSGSRVLVVGGGENKFSPEVRRSSRVIFRDRKHYPPGVDAEIALVVFTTFCNHNVFTHCRKVYSDRTFNGVFKPRALSRSLAAWLDAKEIVETREQVISKPVATQPEPMMMTAKAERGELKAFVELHSDMVRSSREAGDTISKIAEKLGPIAREFGLSSSPSSIGFAVMKWLQVNNVHKADKPDNKVVKEQVLEVSAAPATTTQPAPVQPVTKKAAKVKGDQTSDLVRALMTVTNFVKEIESIRQENKELRKKFALLQKTFKTVS